MDNFGERTMYYHPTAFPIVPRYDGAARLGQAIDVLTEGVIGQQRILLEAMTGLCLAPFHCFVALSAANDAAAFVDRLAAIPLSTLANLAGLPLRACELAARTALEVQALLQQRSHSRALAPAAGSATVAGNRVPARADAWVKTPTLPDDPPPTSAGHRSVQPPSPRRTAQGGRAGVDRDRNELLVRIPAHSTDEERSCVAS
jgi:hypothetical protein